MVQQSNNNTLPENTQFLGIENRNLLSPIGFIFSIEKLKGVDFYCQKATLPAMSSVYSQTGTRFNKIYHPSDELDYEDLTLSFLVDENMKNWYQVHDWLREITTPYSNSEFGFTRGTLESKNKITRRNDNEPGIIANQWKSDCSLFILSSNHRPVAEFVFRDAFPVALSALEFDSTSTNIQYLTAVIKMRYNYFDPYIASAATATDSTMIANSRISERGVILESI